MSRTTLYNKDETFSAEIVYCVHNKVPTDIDIISTKVWAAYDDTWHESQSDSNDKAAQILVDDYVNNFNSDEE